MENRKKVILQAHMDMVPQKNNDTAHDFENDPIELTLTEIGWKLKARLWELMMVWVLPLSWLSWKIKTLKHGPLEALITADEETGMFGGVRLKAGNGRR